MDQQMFSSLSIRTKNVVVVSVLLLAVAAMGAMVLNELGGISANLFEVQVKWLQSALTIDMQAAILRYQTSVRDHLLAVDPDTEARIEATLEIQERKIKDSLALYETFKTSASERVVYEEFARFGKPTRPPAQGRWRLHVTRISQQGETCSPTS